MYLRDVREDLTSSGLGRVEHAGVSEPLGAPKDEVKEVFCYTG